jgi:hypothetical protein
VLCFVLNLQRLEVQKVLNFVISFVNIIWTPYEYSGTSPYSWSDFWPVALHKLAMIINTFPSRYGAWLHNHLKDCICTLDHARSQC